MTDLAPTSTRLPSLVTDLRGLAQLGVDATLGITDLVEHLHGTIAHRAAPLGAPGPHRTRGLTGAIYGSIRGTTRLVGHGLDLGLKLLPRTSAGDGAPSPRREAVLAAVQGIWGDHLEATGNPLAGTMSLRCEGQPLALDRESLAQTLPGATGRIVVLVHGLCMNDLQWHRNGHHHGEMLAAEGGYTALSLRYNSGLHVADNGRRLSALLDELLAHWPVPVQELVLLSHSMGGLVARAACHTGARSPWLKRLTRLVCLGTPHHGAALERGGHRVDTVLQVSPYAAPFARLSRARSAGITDLRYGNVQAAEAPSPAAPRHDTRPPTPLPAGVAVYALAATTAAQPHGLRHTLLGDGLVSVASAWGEHHDPALALHLPPTHKVLVTQASHWDLLSHPEAAAALRRWLL
jgi:hypothetical protein